jgi:hypothetical protein
MSEREWLIPSAMLTAGLGIAAALLMPLAGYDGVPPYLGKFLLWVKYAVACGIVLVAAKVWKLRSAGVESPIAHLRTQFIERKAALLASIAGMLLAGVDMLFFMWIKPEVTAVAPFWADELFADMDHAIFGMDPWRLFEGMDLTFHAWAYSFFWAIAIMAALVWLLAQPSSRERSTSLLSYFALWSVFGPLGQFFFSAAGPIFYSRIGLGDRFAELERNIPEVTHQVSGYLWDMHSNGVLGAGAGISAMPSLHIATVTWIYLLFRNQGSRFAPVAAMFAIYIFAASVALGWHYAVDGIFGAVGALASHAACRAYLGRGAGLKAGLESPAPSAEEPA